MIITQKSAEDTPFLSYSIEGQFDDLEEAQDFIKLAITHFAKTKAEISYHEEDK